MGTAFAALAALAVLAVIIWSGIIALATPTVAYGLDRRFDLGSPEFEDFVSSALATRIVGGNRITRLDNGARFYPEMLAAIAGAHRSIALECYIFHPGQIGDAFIAALVERATAGVHVRIILDAFGSRRLRPHHTRRLTRAGCEVEWPARVYRRRRYFRLVGNRYRGHPPWRDTMVRVEGPVVASCQAVFAENWLECRGDILAGEGWFPPIEPCGTTDAAVVKNSLSFAGSRALFQALIECAAHEIRLTTPYFVPDPSFMSALIERAHHGVSITILLPGTRMDHPWVRRTTMGCSAQASPSRLKGICILFTAINGPSRSTPTSCANPIPFSPIART